MNPERPWPALDTLRRVTEGHGYALVPRLTIYPEFALRPERWLDANTHSGNGHNSHAFLPFGAGPRFCPGRHLAMLEIKMVTAMLCHNFEVVRFPGAPPPEEVFSFTMMPKNLFVMLRERRPA